jgi:hypothetical protein
MRTYRQESRTILFALRASRWASHAEVQEVIVEYGHMENAASTPTQTRRISLQIFHASRAIDTFLGHIADHEWVKSGRPNRPLYWTLDSSVRAIQTHKVGGSDFNTTLPDVQQITKDRNQYLHRANSFPTDQAIQQFLNRTVRAILEATTFRP